MRSFYDPSITATAKDHQLSEEESKHIVKVLRMKIGDSVELLDGKGRSFECEIIEDHPKRCKIKVVQINQEEAPEYDIHIAVSPTKQMERIEWFIEKATEIGITEISFVNCKNSERVKLKVDRIIKKAVSAMKQSKRSFLPKINELGDFKSFINDHPNGLLAHCFEDQKQNMNTVFKLKSCPILIGPEGDFTQEEIELATSQGYNFITLGENRLRTETAALYACMQAKLITS